MVNWQTKIKLILTILITLALASGLQAQSGLWHSLTSHKEVRAMKIINGEVWAVSSGGLIRIFDPDMPADLLTNVDGLGTVDLMDIMQDESGDVWVAGLGQLVNISNNFERFPTKPEYGVIRLNTLADDGSNIWIGSDSGLIQFSKTSIDGGIFRNRFAIRSVNPFPVVNDIMLEGSMIWLATTSGLSVADRTDPTQMLAPSNWTHFDINTNPELESNTILRVVKFEDSIYVLTDERLFKISEGIDTTFTPVVFDTAGTMYDLQVEADTMVVYYWRSIGMIQNDSIVSSILSWPPPITGIGTGTYRWAVLDNGLGIFENRSGSLVEYVHTGTPGNSVTDISIDDDGSVMAGFSLKLSAVLENFDLNKWNKDFYSPGHPTTHLFHGNFGNRWVGTIGGGLWRLNGDTAIRYNDTINNSTIVGNNDDPPISYFYSVITGLDFDGPYLFASCFKAYDNNPVAFAQLDATGNPVAWGSLGLSDGITDVDIVTLDLHDNILVAGSGNTGIFYCEIGTDPFDKSDDVLTNFRTANSLLPSDLIRVVKFSPDGELWAGTNFGLSHLVESLGQEGEIGRWVLLEPSGFGPDITAIEFDSRGNAWVGASNGLLFISVSDGSFEHFTTANSDLVSDDVRAITVAPVTGDVWVGTSDGISIKYSITGRLTPKIDSILAHPNPFVIRSSSDQLVFPFEGQYTIRIFNMAGELVWKVEELSQATWDGRNQNGEPVAQGVYLFVLRDAEGQVGTGKFLLVREQ